MKTIEAIRRMVSEAEGSQGKLSAKAGRSPRYISALLGNGGAPNSETLAMVADVCEWDLLVRKRSSGEEIIIDPPERV